MIRGYDVINAYIEQKLKAINYDIDIAKDTLSMAIWIAAGSLTILVFTITYADKFNGFIMTHFFG